METKNATMEQVENEDLESLEFDELELKLQEDLKLQLSDLEFLKEEEKKIGTPEKLGDTVMNVVWEQFMNQMAVVCGEEFIKENKGLKLDLRKDAHIQTTENFEKGKIATHNHNINYQERYDEWQDNFQKDKVGKIVTHKTRSGKEEAILTKDARKVFDKGRSSGSVEKKTDMDHTVSAGEIIRDSTANAHLSKEEQIKFANSDKNLNEMDASLNRSKGDKATKEWLDNPNANGQKPNEIFDISAEDDKKLRQKDDEAREEYEKLKDEGEKKSVEAGKKSRKEEAFKVGGAALRTIIMQLLAELIKEIFAKLVQWFKSAKRNLKSLLGYIETAIKSFVSNLKKHVINAGSSALTTIATAIIGPVIRTIKKAWMFLKQGGKSLKESIDHIKDPTNKDKPIGILMMEVGKIAVAGFGVAGAIVLGEVIEKGLVTVGPLAIEIPIIGSLASLIGIFMGGVVAGVVGAIVLNLIDKAIEKKQRDIAINHERGKNNQILGTQKLILEGNDNKLETTKIKTYNSMKDRHDEASEMMKETIGKITIGQKENRENSTEINYEDDFETMLGKLNKLSK